MIKPSPVLHAHKAVLIRKHTGFSLIELMIAMVLGIIIIGAIIAVFLGTSQTYRTQEAMSTVQESGRFAIETMTRDIRQIGFRGACLPEVTINNLLDTDASNELTLDFSTGALQGWHQGAGPYAGDMNGYVANTDTLLIKKVANMDVRPNGNTPKNAANVNLNGPSGITREQIVVISDAESCDIFQNTANDNATTVARGAVGGMDPGNINPSNDLSKAYDAEADLFRFEPRVYYLGTSTAIPTQTALRRIDFGSGAANDQEIVTGVADFRVRYGVDTSGDRRVNQYVNAATVSAGNDWENVLAVRVYLIVGSPDSNNVVDNAQQLTLDGGVWNAPDRSLYQVFSSTIAIRNRLN